MEIQEKVEDKDEKHKYGWLDTALKKKSVY